MTPDKFKNILWDFDGVILDSLKVKDYGFFTIAQTVAPQVADQFLAYHQLNGGLSRFLKFRYLYETLLGQEVSEARVAELSAQFSDIMVASLTDPKNLIAETVQYIKKFYTKQRFHVVSGTEQNELRFLAGELKLTDFFVSIEGSPVHKNDLVCGILDRYGYKKNETCLIGDSINDEEAAKVNGITFLAFNNENLRSGRHYIETFETYC